MNMSESLLPVTSNCRTGIKRSIKWLVIHETGNKDKGANARAHASYLNNVAKAKTPSVSWHYTVDDNQIIQHIPDDEVAWHAGDGRTPNGGNMCGIGIELCVNSDGDFNKTLQNAGELVAFLCKKYGFLNVGGIVRQHWEFTGKNCPQTIREKGLWQEFLNNCQSILGKLNEPPSPTPQTDYKTLYDNALSELTGAKNALLLEKSKNDILEGKVLKLSTAIANIDNVIKSVGG
jgi:N-acetylmuramoyl-L-alanine amidase CwlA